MSATTGHEGIGIARPSFENFRHGIVALIFITSLFTRIEPALTDFLGSLAILLFFNSGLHFSRHMAAPMLFLIIYLAAGIVAVIPLIGLSFFPDQEPSQYTIGIAYVAATGVFLAGYIGADPVNRYLRFEKAYWIGATLGSILGLLIFFKVQPFFALNALGNNELGDFLYRVRGGYKDPNVFSTWLVFPVISMLQAFLLGRLRPGLISLGSFAAMVLALLLAFSRGAWIDAAAGSAIMVALSLMLTPSQGQRLRITIVIVIGIAAVIGLLVLLLSIPSMQALFADRFVLVKNYDAGETGRFGNQLNSIPMLLQRPLGFGPYQFSAIFHLAPHNTFLGSFASAGWAGGLFYLLLFVTHIFFAYKTIFTRSPYQPFAIAIYSCYLVMIMQGVQIDNEHWRHLYWMMGAGWALYGATAENLGQPFRRKEILEGWGVPDGGNTGGAQTA
ncbi:MAG: O-antigen ligase family protein [Alphaproteobacteria bacterium]|nr:O-antigen ligase family protein [Alphaproteobacteria bacterium]